MNTHLTNIFSLSSFDDTKAEGQLKRLTQRIATWFSALGDLPRRHREAAELAGFNDRELSDIGLTRSDLDRIQSPEFAVDYNKRRNSALFLTRI